MKAEKLITLYLEQNGTSPQVKKRMNKGQSVKFDKIDDIPFRDQASNVDQDITWASSSKAPFR